MALVEFSFAELIKPVTRTEARAAIYNVLGRLGISTSAWEPGSVVRSQVMAASSMFAALSELQADMARAGFLEFARGPWLRMVARYVYGVEPLDATYASGEVTLTNLGGGMFDVDAGDLVVRNADTGRVYRNVADFSLPSGNGQSVTITVMAVESGAASNANAGAISEFVTPLMNVVVSNEVALIGLDAEAPEQLKARCREKLGSLSPNGPWDAYSYVARNAKLSTGAPVGVTRTRVTRDGFGNLYLTVANASGNVSAPALAAIDDAVQKNAAPLGITAHVQSATAAAIPVVYTAYVRTGSGLTAEDVRAAAAAALVEHFSTATETPIGGIRLTPEGTGYVFADAIRAAIHNSVPEIFRVVLSAPAGDVPLTDTQVPVLQHNPDTQATINIVAQAEGL